ncbi:MAG: abortive infection family protein, partial [Eubacterium sp.]|nr:abortive infection family protein [Eubacterium sp.]
LYHILSFCATFIFQTRPSTNSMWEVILTLPGCNLYIEETGLFTYKQWNTYCSILHIQVPINKHECFIKEKENILGIAESIYGRQGDNLLTDIDIGILIEHYEVIDFSSISLTEVIGKAIADAELFMQQGKYDSALDRIHTAFHGYLRKLLDNKNVSYEESDTLSQLYTKLHTKITAEIGSSAIADLIKTTLRSASGIISSMNDLRNRHSLSHPNDDLLEKREAEMAIALVKTVCDYINKVI